MAEDGVPDADPEVARQMIKAALGQDSDEQVGTEMAEAAIEDYAELERQDLKNARIPVPTFGQSPIVGRNIGDRGAIYEPTKEQDMGRSTLPDSNQLSASRDVAPGTRNKPKWGSNG